MAGAEAEVGGGGVVGGGGTAGLVEEEAREDADEVAPEMVPVEAGTVITVILACSALALLRCCFCHSSHSLRLKVRITFGGGSFADAAAALPNSVVIGSMFRTASDCLGNTGRGGGRTEPVEKVTAPNCGTSGGLIPEVRAEVANWDTPT